MRTEIPLLQNVRVASPCHADWDEMQPIDSDRVRFCQGCRKNVYNLSEMGQAEAEGLLRAHEGHLCVRYYRRLDGTILTADCPVGLRAAQQLVLTRTRASVGLCMLLCVALAAYNASIRTTSTPVAGGIHSVANPPPPEVTWTTGMVSAVPEQPRTSGQSKSDTPSEPRMGRPEPVMGEPTTTGRVLSDPSRYILGALQPIEFRPTKSTGAPETGTR